MACDFIWYGASYILFTKTQSSYEALFPAYVHSEFSLKEQSTFSWHVILIISLPLRYSLLKHIPLLKHHLLWTYIQTFL